VTLAREEAFLSAKRQTIVCTNPLKRVRRWAGGGDDDDRERQMSQTVADVLVGVLEQTGVKHIFGLIGDSLNPLADALRRSR
jgi:hypothetical protein